MKRSMKLIVLCCLFVSACGTQVYRPPTSRPFEMDPGYEIDDGDIRAAYEARPQLSSDIHVAYFTYETSRAEDIEAMLDGLPGVEDTYRIPPFLVTGEHRYGVDEARPAYYTRKTDRPLSVKKLRLLAARARADVLVVVGYGYRWRVGANGWVATTALLVPTFFAPFLNTEVHSYLDSYVIDVRNGYLDGHVQDDLKAREKFHTIYASKVEELAARQWPRLISDTKDALASILRAGRTADAQSPTSNE